MASLEEIQPNTSEESSEGSSCRLQKQFDLTQWYYWSVWWQSLLQWQHQSYIAAAQQNNGPQPINNHFQFPSNYQFFVQPPLTQRGYRPTPPVRTINGYETCIAKTWRRLFAEFIDILLVSIILKWFIPGLDYRIPESIFLGSDVVLKMEDDEMEEMGWSVLIFVSSIVLERFVHSIMETLFTYRHGCTIGKYLMGLRIYRCTQVQLTRTNPGHTIKIVPGTRMGFWQACIRAMFKFSANMFCPLIIFFIVLDKGRTQYDRAFKCVIVNKRELYRPIYTIYNNNNN